MSLDSGKRKSDTVRHTTWIKCIESETRHTYTWSIWCWQKKVANMGFHDAIQSCCGHWAFQADLSWLFGYRFGIGWGIRGWYREYVKKLSCRDQLKTRQLVAGLQIHNSKTDWICTRNPCTEVIRVSVFGTSPIGYISVWCMVPLHEVHRNLICVFGTFCPVLLWSSGVVLLFKIVILYQIKLGLKQRTQTPEIRKIRNLSTKKHGDHSYKPGNEQPGNSLAERRNAQLPESFHVGKFQTFSWWDDSCIVKLRAWVSKAKTEMEFPGSPFVQRRGFFGFGWLFSQRFDCFPWRIPMGLV